MSRPLLFHCPHAAEPWASPCSVTPLPGPRVVPARSSGPQAPRPVPISSFHVAFRGLYSQCLSHSGRQGAEVARLQAERAGRSDAPLPSQARCQQAAVGGGCYFC